MANFPTMTLTNAGINLQTRVLAGEKITFTKMKMGDGDLNGQPVTPLTDLVHSALIIENLIGAKKSTTDFELQGFFSNESVESGFWWREIGVFAKGEDGVEVLYCYANAGGAGDYIPVVTEQRIEKYLFVSFAVGNAENVTLNINGSDTYVTTQRKINGKPLTADIDLTAEDLGIESLNTYTHTYDTANKLHNFVGTGENGKIKILYDYIEGDRFAINGTVYPCYTGEQETVDLMLGHWIYFVFDGEAINIIAGGGSANTIGIELFYTYTAVGGETQVSVIGGDIDAVNNTDIIDIYLDNVPIFPGENFTFNADKTKITFAEALTAGQKVRFEVMHWYATKISASDLDYIIAHIGNGDLHLNAGIAPKAKELSIARKIGNASFNGTADVSIEQIGAAEKSHIHKAFAIQFNGETKATYTGETDKTVNITPESIGAATAAQGALAQNAMPKSGGTFSGPVTLAGAPTSNLHATTKKYVDEFAMPKANFSFDASTGTLDITL